MAVICKKCYIETIINECRLNIKSYNNISTLNVNDIYCEQLRYLKSIRLESDVKDILPHIVLSLSFISLNCRKGLWFLMLNVL